MALAEEHREEPRDGRQERREERRENREDRREDRQADVAAVLDRQQTLLRLPHQRTFFALDRKPPAPHVFAGTCLPVIIGSFRLHRDVRGSRLHIAVAAGVGSARVSDISAYETDLAA